MIPASMPSREVLAIARVAEHGPGVILSLSRFGPSGAPRRGLRDDADRAGGSGQRAAGEVRQDRRIARHDDGAVAFQAGILAMLRRPPQLPDVTRRVAAYFVV
jgi:hypothetical protein